MAGMEDYLMSPKVTVTFVVAVSASIAIFICQVIANHHPDLRWAGWVHYGGYAAYFGIFLWYRHRERLGLAK